MISGTQPVLAINVSVFLILVTLHLVPKSLHQIYSTKPIKRNIYAECITEVNKLYTRCENFRNTIVANISLGSIHTSTLPDYFNLLPRIEKSVLPDLLANPRNFVVIGKSEGAALTVPICVST